MARLIPLNEATTAYAAEMIHFEYVGNKECWDRECVAELNEVTPLDVQRLVLFKPWDDSIGAASVS
jgi:hypothetical protein